MLKTMDEKEYEKKVIDGSFGVLEVGISAVMERTRGGGDAEATQIAAGVRDRLVLLLYGVQEDLRVGRRAGIDKKVECFSDYVRQILNKAGDQDKLVMGGRESDEFADNAPPVCDRVVTDASFLRGVIFSGEDGLGEGAHIVEKLLELSTGELVWLDVLFRKEEMVNFNFEEALPGSYNYGVVKKSGDELALGRFFGGVEESMNALYRYHRLDANDENWGVPFERIKDAVLGSKKSISLDYGEALAFMRACDVQRSSVTRLNFRSPEMGGPRLDRLDLCLPGGVVVSCEVQDFDGSKEKWQFLLKDE